LAAALRQLGAQIEFVDRPGYPPLKILGQKLHGGRVRVDAAESSQYLSAVLMAALVAERQTLVEVTALTSQPYVAVTLGVIEAFGGAVSAEGSRYRVQPRPLSAERFEVEADLSAACYPAAAAVLTGGRVFLEGVSRRSRQGDLEFLDLLERLGAGTSWSSDGVEVWSEGSLSGIDADLSRMPDQVPTLAALAPFASGTTRIVNVPHLRLKESDRLGAMHQELTALGAVVRQLEDGLEIDGTWAESLPSGEEVVVSSHDDHRIAMSLALVGLRRPGVAVDRPEVVRKSYPAFWDDLARIIDEPP
jgi:3-phosphoshikimate 1-carboxyvinyltransferase